MPLLSTRGAGSIRSFGFAGASAPLNLAIPSISGTTTVGNALTSSTGTWTGTPPISFAYQWKRAGSNISGATSSSYTLIAADAGNTITVTVTASNSVTSVASNSNATATIAQIPTISIAPTVSGATLVGNTLTSTTGTWDGFPASFTYAYQWRRAGSNISGATSSTYTTVAGDVSSAVTCAVTATNSTGSATSVSSNSITVTAPVGQTEYTSPGSYSWTAPSGVTSVAVVAVGPGSGNGYHGSPGGGLGWKNNIAVTPGSSYTVFVGAIQSGQASYFINSSTVAGNGAASSGSGASYVGDGGGSGGGDVGGSGGGAGAGGYTGSGGQGIANASNGGGYTGNNGSGGGGGGGGGCNYNGGGGGGVGIYGAGASGNGGQSGGGGQGGSGGSAGQGSSSNQSGGGGSYGGSGGGCQNGNVQTPFAGTGAVRIIWGPSRAFPSSGTANQ